MSGLSWKMRLRLTSALLTSKYGFSVVAPIRMTVPFSTHGSRASCCALLKRWTSSTKRIVRWPYCPRRSWAVAMACADVGDAGEHGVDGDEVGAGGVGDDARQGGLAGAGRAVEDDRAELVGLDGAAQEPPGPDDVLLADELVEGARAHARGQRRLALDQFLAAGVKQVREMTARLAWCIILDEDEA